MNKLTRNQEFAYQPIYRKISGYTTTYNAASYPFVESIKSMLGFCDEVVVVDGCSTDGTWELLQSEAEKDNKIKLFQKEFDWEEPGIDGIQKGFARALCENEFLWQQDCDEVCHERDYEKIKLMVKKFPKQADILHLPVIEMWGNGEEVTGRRHAWKWRLSRNKPEITHGINNHARVTDEKTGRVYAKKGMSDGCEYVNTMNNEMLPHVGFYSDQIETARLYVPADYAKIINQLVNHIPSVYHYSWCSIPRKTEQLKKGGVWDKLWSLLYQEESQDRFPGFDFEILEEVQKLAQHLYKQGGEDSDKVKYKFKLDQPGPSIMQEWIESVQTHKE
jgi:glycosyltransferase involved in cell wall biosynthesis